MVNIINSNHGMPINSAVGTIILPVHKATNNENEETLSSKARTNKSKRPWTIVLLINCVI